MRWHAFRDAPRHRSASRCTFKRGRRASRTAFPRRACGTIVVWEGTSGRTLAREHYCANAPRRAAHSREDAERPER
ncbi:hypothetical protein CCL07_08215 [Pseudomonas congelans]|nr:hypothetical protein CCL07_08215 [Pseudomonas congelans]